jgi:hypothetical protein
LGKIKNKGIKMKEFFGAVAIHALFAFIIVWLILKITG